MSWRPRSPLSPPAVPARAWPTVTFSDSGATVKVPPFIDVGERIRVEVETGKYFERAKARG